MFIYIFKSLACLALQMETIVKKITKHKLPKKKNEFTKICNEPGVRDGLNVEYEIWKICYKIKTEEAIG